MSYYGTDQTQAQRLISAKDENASKKILLTNGLLRFPVVDLLYNGFNHWSVGKFNT
jgi:hypothetical protein